MAAQLRLRRRQRLLCRHAGAALLRQGQLNPSHQRCACGSRLLQLALRPLACLNLSLPASFGALQPAAHVGQLAPQPGLQRGTLLRHGHQLLLQRRRPLHRQVHRVARRGFSSLQLAGQLHVALQRRLPRRLRLKQRRLRRFRARLRLLRRRMHTRQLDLQLVPLRAGGRVAGTAHVARGDLAVRALWAEHQLLQRAQLLLYRRQRRMRQHGATGAAGARGGPGGGGRGGPGRGGGCGPGGGGGRGPGGGGGRVEAASGLTRPRRQHARGGGKAVAHPRARHESVRCAAHAASRPASARPIACRPPSCRPALRGAQPLAPAAFAVAVSSP
mmetsp:Transcript_24816/g.62399  ORF Transcript_24816/g.62399 Transcript_24816/m.62399 type:complete len:330 (+) Transcript_24816:1105-2094(+)